MANLGDMVVSIVGDTTGLNKSLTDSQKKMAAFGVNVAAITAAVIQLGKVAAKAVKEFSDYGSAIFDAGQKTGLSTDAIQEWKFIAEQTGATLESVTGAVGMMTRGLQTNKDTFEKLGIEVKNADGTFKSTTDIFNDTVATLSAMTDETERDQMAFKLLGRSAQSLIPILNSGEAGIKGMRDEAHNLGLVLDKETISNADKLGDSTDALKASLANAKNEIINNLSPSLIKIADNLKEAISKTIEWQKYIDALKGRTQTTNELEMALRGVVASTKELTSQLSNPAYARNFGEIQKQIEANNLLEQSLRRQVVEYQRAQALNKQGTDAKKEEIAVIKEKIAVVQEEKKEEIDLGQIRADQYGDWIINNAKALDEIEQRQADHVASTKQNALDIAQAWGDAYTMVISATKPVFDEIGSSLVDGTFAWKDLGSAAVNSIGRIVSALGDQLAAESAIDLVKGFAALASIINAPLAPGYFASAAIKAGGAAAAWATGGALSTVKLAEGGIVMPSEGGTLAQIAEAGQPEAVIPLDKLGGLGGDIHLVVQLDSKPFLDKIFPATRDRTILISSGAVV